MRSEKKVRTGPKGSERSESGQRERSEKSESPLGLGLSDREPDPDPTRTGVPTHSTHATTPTRARVSDLLVDTFGGTVAWYTTPDGREHGTRPDWFDWPTVRGDEMGPPIVPAGELAKRSKGSQESRGEARRDKRRQGAIPAAAQIARPVAGERRHTISVAATGLAGGGA